MKTTHKNDTKTKAELSSDENKTSETKKRLSAFGKFMLENRGMVTIVDMKAVMQ